MKKIKILFISLFLILIISFNTIASEQNINQKETKISVEEELEKASDDIGLSGLDLILYSLDNADGEIKFQVIENENKNSTTLSENIFSFLKNILIIIFNLIYENIIYFIIIIILSIILFIRKRKADKEEIQKLMNERKRGE